MSDGLVDALQAKLKNVAGVLAESGASEFQATAREEYDHGTALEWFEALEQENQQLRERVAALEQHVDAISDIGAEKTTKEEKIAAIVTWAKRQADDPAADRVLVKPKEIKGIADVSERYAYGLVDDLPAEYAWLLDRHETQQYGDAERSTATQQRGLVVDLELLHEDGAALNKFNNGMAAVGVS